jgi:AraC family transcriptional regulator
MSLNVEIPESLWCEVTSDVVRKHGLVGPVLSGDVEWAAFAVWREFHTDDDASTLALGESVALLFAQLMKSHARGSFEPHQRLDRCIEYLCSHQSRTPALSEVARIANVHPMHLAKLFRKRFGYSMGEWVRRQRVAWACDQLSRGTDTISSIAIAAGFADHAHFTRAFRRMTGSTPSWYRNHSCGTSTRIPEQTLESLAQHSAPA